MSREASVGTEERVAKLEARVEKLERIIAAFGAAFGVGDDIADDAELDGKYGNEPIRRDPTERFWTGETFVGKRPSECTPEYLDARAKYLDLCAKLKEKDGKQKYADYDRRDARLARGWARRLRSGWQPPPPKPRTTSSNGANGSSRSTGGGFGARTNGAGPFGGDASFGRQAPPPPPSEPEPMGDDDFNFGHNATDSSTEDYDDDPPL